MLQAQHRFVLRYPDGTEQVTEGTGDRFGHFISPQRWRLDQAGIYVYRITADWNGHKGCVPGLPQDGGYLFVRESATLNQLD